jgi:hypothetical protein
MTVVSDWLMRRSSSTSAFANEGAMPAACWKPAPTTRLPAGHVTNAVFDGAEEFTLSAVTRCRPESGYAHTAHAVCDQVPEKPSASSKLNRPPPAGAPPKENIVDSPTWPA